ncbi:MAG: VWA domain-containing protein [Chloroflexia bacterium]|nr:VWA domain-containing protein [Chloroflexia bacterium]
MRTSWRSSRWLVFLLAFGILFLAMNPGFGSATQAAQDAQPTEAAQGGGAVNVELVLDSSGSMAQEVSPGVTRIDAAKDVLNDLIEAIPEREGVNVGFRVFGHEGSNQEADRAESCQSTDLITPIEGVNKDALRGAVEGYQPVGWTPITLALQEGGGDFPPEEEGVTNAIVMVTDGLETCDGDPCAAAQALAQGDVSVTSYVIGFGLTAEEQATLQCIADAGGGLNLGAGSAEELNEALFTVFEELQVVVQTGFLEIEAFGNVWPRATINCRTGATDSNPEGEIVSVTLTDSNRVELNAGVCEVRWANPSGQETIIRVNIDAGQTTWIRGSLLKFPQGAGEIYVVRDIAGVIIWQDQFEQGDYVWVLPGIYQIDLLERVGDPILISAEVQCLPGTATQLEIWTGGS